jgi:hypothetical protein
LAPKRQKVQERASRRRPWTSAARPERLEPPTS